MRENSSSTTAWWQWSSWFSGRASLSTTEEEEEVYEEGGLRQARGEGRRPRVSPRGGGQADWISLGKILGRLAPQAKQVEACLPSQVEAPHLPK